MAKPETTEPQPLLVQFKPHKEKKLPNGKPSQPLQAVEIKNGHYLRKFDAKEQPFAVESQDELQMLLRTGHFVEHKEPDETDADGEQSAPPSEETAAATATAKKAKTKESRRRG